jgi:hypothetical protein
MKGRDEIKRNRTDLEQETTEQAISLTLTRLSSSK